MRLKKIRIVNFRNLKDLNFDFRDDKNSIIFCGKNGLGKSSIIDSLLWLLCDETKVYGLDNSGNLDVNLKNQAVEVEATFIKDDGNTLKLKRVLAQSFNKQGVFKGYSNDLYINEAVYSVKDFFARIKTFEFGINLEKDSDVKGFNTLRSVLDYNYFNTIKYQVAREKLEKLSNITSDNSIANNPDFALIKDELMAQLFDVSKVKTKLNKEKAMKEGAVATLNSQYETLKACIDNVDVEEIKNVQNRIEKVKETTYTHSSEYMASLHNMNQSSDLIREKESQLYSFKKNVQTMGAELKNYHEENSKYKNELECLRQQFVNVKKTETHCPKCNYSLNKEVVIKQLKELNEKGQKINDYIKVSDEKVIKAKQSYNDLVQELEKVQSEFEDFKIKQEEKSKNLIALIQKENNEERIFNETKQEELLLLNSKLHELNNNNDVKRFEEIKRDLEIARKELANAETKLMLLEEFATFKNKLINDKVKQAFPNLDFRLFEESDTGTISNTCKVFLRNVEYSSVNTGNQVLLGIEVLTSLRNAFGISETLPLIFDDVSNLDSSNYKKVADKGYQVITTCVTNDDNITIKEI